MYSAVLYMFCAINMYVERERKRQSVLVGPGRSGGECPDEKEREYGSPHKDARQGEEGERERERQSVFVGPGRSGIGNAPPDEKEREYGSPHKDARPREERERERDGASWWVLAGLVGNAPPDEKGREYGSPHIDARLREDRRRDKTERERRERLFKRDLYQNF